MRIKEGENREHPAFLQVKYWDQKKAKKGEKEGRGIREDGQSRYLAKG